MIINRDNSKNAYIKDTIEIGIENAYNLTNTTMFKNIRGFRIPESNVLRNKYRQVIDGLCIELKFTSDEFSKYRYRPKTLSLALYGTVDLWHTLMWLNNIPSATQFDVETLRVIDPKHLKEIRMILEKESENLIATRRT